jgi:putative Holliday junction resolvase
MKTYLGIDYGAKRIGLALGTDETKLAHALKTLDGENWHEALREVIDTEKIDELVVGLPRTLDGDYSTQTIAVREFAMGLAILGLPLHLQDEAGTSSVARERLGKNIKDKGQIDAEAAAIILQDYLDSI